VLKHSLEVSHLAGVMAAELGVDVKLAKRAGLLHDLGKAIDHEIEGPHAVIGADLARRMNEPKAVLHCIEAHHGDVEPATVEAVLVQAADAISAGRPGARRETLESYVKRLEKLEAVAQSHAGVEKCYAMQAGREIRVMVSPIASATPTLSCSRATSRSRSKKSLSTPVRSRSWSSGEPGGRLRQVASRLIRFKWLPAMCKKAASRGLLRVTTPYADGIDCGHERQRQPVGLRRSRLG
jgi:putative nucleotidyltransferase with HDIG domain